MLPFQPNHWRHSFTKVLPIKAIIIAFAAISLGGCDADNIRADQDGYARPLTSDYRLRNAQSCSDIHYKSVEGIVDQILLDRYLTYVPDEAYGLSTEPTCGDAMDYAEGAPPPKDGKYDELEANDGLTYTGTNNHEAAADEADWVKTTGDYTFVLSKSSLKILKTWAPDQMKVVKVFDRADFFPKGTNPYSQDVGIDFIDLTFDGKRLTVFAKVHPESYREYYRREVFESIESMTPRSIMGFHLGSTITRAATLDVSNPEEARIVSVVDTSMSYADARTVASGTYVVEESNFGSSPYQVIGDQNSELEIRKLTKPIRDYLKASGEDSQWGPIGALVASVDKSVMDKVRYDLHNYIVSKYPVEEIEKQLPKAIYWDDDFQNPRGVQLLSCEDLYITGADTDTQLTVVMRLPEPSHAVGSSTNSDVVGIVSGVRFIYSTGSDILLTQHLRENNRSWAGRTSTAIHRIKYGTGEVGMTYQGSGKVDGIVRNQFAMSARGPYLRVFSEVSKTVEMEPMRPNQLPWRERMSSTSLNVLSLDGLGIVASIDDIAPGESIKSSRFVGDKGYVVTFRQTDPLFTFDLSQPLYPKLLGELTIPGFSTYMHPLDDEHLLTIGYAGTRRGALRAIQLQVFDVSDMQNPVVSAQNTITARYSVGSSAALHDSHAFTYDPRTKLLSIPIRTYRPIGADDQDELDDLDGLGGSDEQEESGDRESSPERKPDATEDPDEGDRYELFSGHYFFSVANDSIVKIGEINHIDAFKNQTCVNDPYSRECYSFSDRYSKNARSIIMTGNPESRFSDIDNLKTFIFTISSYGITSQPSSDFSVIYALDLNKTEK